LKYLAQDYYLEIEQLLKSIKVMNKESKELNFYEGISHAAELIEMQIAFGRKLIFIGNGASAAISSHQATDFWKNGAMKAIAFNDASSLTCISNDFGYKHVFEKPINMFADLGDVLIAISSSGRSENILLGVSAARTKGTKVITLSGFDKNNPLKKLGEFNFYVPSHHYGHVEILHLSICHCLLDIIIQKESELIKKAISDKSPDDMCLNRQDLLLKRPKLKVKTLEERRQYDSQIVDTCKLKSSLNSKPEESHLAEDT